MTNDLIEIFDVGMVIIHKDHLDHEGNKKYIADLHSKGHPYILADGTGNTYAVFPDGLQIQVGGRSMDEESYRVD